MGLGFGGKTDAQANAKAVWPCVQCLDRESSVATLNSVLLRFGNVLMTLTVESVAIVTHVVKAWPPSGRLIRLCSCVDIFPDGRSCKPG